ncbi:MAG: hypothetical protein IPK16_03045 [Anaerolineales bacterium]|nr:hypothetical protein [Anaerolineales bacterium]
MSDEQTFAELDLHEMDTGEAPPAAAVEEFNWLMSLALDEMLDDGERVRFAGYLREYPSFAATWAEWLAFDRQLVSVPRAVPESGFVERFNAALVQREARERRTVLMAMTAAVVVVAVMTAAGFFGAGAYVLSTQGPWIGEQVRNLLYVSVMANHWIEALSGTLLAILNAPQTRAVVVAYAVAAAVFIVWWIQLLRRSARLSPALTAPGME